MALTFVPVRIASVGGNAAARWAEGMQFTLPRTILERTGWIDRLGPDRALAIAESPVNVLASDVVGVREHAAFTDRLPISARLPVSYQRVPGWLRAALASLAGRVQRHNVRAWAAFPGWPLDLTVDLLSDLAAAPRVDVGDRTPVLLTHDIDSPEGLKNLVAEFLPREEAAGAHSTNYIVPCGWPPDEGLVAEVRRRGHEVGVHGYDHSNRTPFAPDDERRQRLDAPRPFAERHGATGYRAPSLLRTRALVRDLASRYDYDSSIPTSGGLFPVPNNGCATARPFVVEGIVEIPLTLPRDGSLRFLGDAPAAALRTWIDCADAIARSGGVVVLLTHCEARFSGNRPMLDIYDRFLDHVRQASTRFVFSTPGELLPRIRASLKTHSAPVPC